MPIGAAKLGVLGAGLVPGGTETFNAPGTFSIPPGVKKVSVTGKGATGNPGNAGNAGNPGNVGNGGGGGAGGGANKPPNSGSPGPTAGVCGGLAFKRVVNQSPQGGNGFTINPGVSLNSPSCCFARGGSGAPTINSGDTGSTGNAGQAGQAGNPGNTGQSSTGLGNTFPGGAGGNAGVAGAAGNGGSGGTGGTLGNPGSPTPQGGTGGTGGAGGNGGGSGARGPNLVNTCRNPAFFPYIVIGGQGGGGAGTVNSGQGGLDGKVIACPQRPSNPFIFGFRSGGSGGCTNAPIRPLPQWNLNPTPTSTMGGYAGGTPSVPGVDGRRSVSLEAPDCCFGVLRASVPQFNPSCRNTAAFQSIFRAGGGGGAGRSSSSACESFGAGGGAGGGGRGNAGNAGGTSPTPSGAAANPTTFNCVTVTPGSTTPIVVASPGGQIVISWNPQ